MKVYKTTYDNYFVIVKNNKITCYEGLMLCPKNIKEYIESNESKVKKLDCFFMDAISYGYIK